MQDKIKKDPLLIELLTEELPPKSLANVAKAFQTGITKALAERGFVKADLLDKPVNLLATPRRLAVVIPNVLKVQPDQMIERKGPYVSAGLDQNGQPTPALLGFAKSCGVAVEKLKTASDNKGEHYIFKTKKRGEPLAKHITEIVQQTLKKLPIAKLMRWSHKDVEFVRPVHGLIIMHGTKIIPAEILGLKSGKKTLGHRFLSAKPITLKNAKEYQSHLKKEGYVIADFIERKNVIAKELHTIAAKNKAILVEHENLLDEVTALVEYPVIYTGEFDKEFLSVPQECLILSMKQHQKYFPLVDKKGMLLPKFLIVSNMKTTKPKNIIEGNERVIRARLSDAKFFYDQDQKTKLEKHVPQLAHVIYHNKLGSQLDRVKRIQAIAKSIAEKLKVNQALADRAAYLCKADLLTNMVGEFPELQGIMGQYYARHDHEPEEVAVAIEAHYHPRFANDTLPQNNLGTCVSLAEKLDTLVGIYGIGLIPTGDKDPYGLRRNALSVLRILLEGNLALNLVKLLQFTAEQFPKNLIAQNTVKDLHGFMLERLRGYLRERNYPADQIEAVVGQSPVYINQVPARLDAVKQFRKMPEAEALAAANKRIRNILKKAEGVSGQVKEDLIREPAEKDLFESLHKLQPIVQSHVAKQAYTEALRELSGVKAHVDRFFDDVMVMAEDMAVRNNRLALLKQLDLLMNQVADISKLGSTE